MPLALTFFKGTPTMYGTVQEADQHHAAAGNAAWLALDTAVKTANLNLASRVLDAMFEAEFIGVRTDGINQEHAWPRSGSQVIALGLDPMDIPVAVERAAFELADMIRRSPAAWSQVYEPGRMVKRKTVGPITTEYAVPTELGGQAMPQVPIIRGWLFGLLRNEDSEYRRRVLPIMVV